MEIVERTLGEICDEGGGVIRTGPFGSQLHQSDYKEFGVPVVMPKDIVGDKLLEDSIARIGKEDVERLSQHILREGDIVYGRRGDIGRQALITKNEAGWLCGTGCLRITLGNSLLFPRFLHYYLRQSDVIGWIYNQAVGATMPNLNTSILRSVPIKYPLLETQRKIASILSAYDDLIENNTRRIKILEEMAQAIYREWFVNFRFPGHEKVKMVDSPLGKIPEGWEVVKLSDIAEINAKSLSKKNASDTINYIDISSVSTGSIDKVEELVFSEAPSRARRIVQHGDVIWATVRPNRKSYSLILKPIDDLIVSTGFAVLTPTKVPYTYLYQAITTEDFAAYLVNNATGSAYPAVNAGDFKNADVLFPSREILNVFHESTEGHYLLKQNLELKNKTLRQTRDLLLPKLISGAIDVEQLEIDVKESSI